jgi:hypothetical protein
MEEFLRGPKAEEFHRVWRELPAEVQPWMDEYLHLFAPELKKMGLARATRIVAELLEMVRSGTVQIQGEAARPAPVGVWTVALRKTIAGVRRKGGRLENHNYLRKVAFAEAGPGAVKAELDLYEEHRSRSRSPAQAEGGRQQVSARKPFSPLPKELREDAVNEEERTEVVEMLRSFRKAPKQ